MNTSRKEFIFATVTGGLAIVATFLMPYLVAKPKVLFGRSLSAIPPSLFPYVTLSLTALLSLILMLIAWRTHQYEIKSSGTTPLSDQTEPVQTDTWKKKSIFFILLTGYGLLLKPIGFLASSALAIALTSLLLGNRNWMQIALISVLAPICLYLIATRGMLVSLPELNSIELLYAQLIDRIQGVVRQ